MDNFVIRECKVEDAKRIYEINTCTFGYYYPEEKTQIRLQYILSRKTDMLYVACVGDEVVGYIHGSDYECTYSDSLKNIMAIAVDEKFQGRGIGKSLLQAIEKWAIRCKCCGVRLVSSMNREKAHEFYLHCGYITRKEQKNFIKLFE